MAARGVGRLVQRLLIVVVVVLVILLPPHRLLRIMEGGDGMVQNGLQQFTICGKARAPEGADPMSGRLASDILEAAPGSRMGVWGIEEQGGCQTFVHGPPGAD